MTGSQKAAFTLLISVVLFAGFTVLAYTGLFDLVEAKFYNPSIIVSLTNDVNHDAESVGNFLAGLEDRFAATLREEAVRRSFLPNQSAEDIFERSRIYGILLESLGGLQWVRFIDAGGTRLHYSTYQADILFQDQRSMSYRNYTDVSGSVPYERIASSDQGRSRLILDQAGERILFSFPFYDSFDVFRGTAAFSLSVRAVGDRLTSEGRIKAGENVSIVENPPGILTGLPVSSAQALLPGIASIWDEGLLNLTTLDSGSGISLALISARTGQGFFQGRLVNEALFEFPQVMKIILLVSFFLTVYLTVFLLFNIRQDSFTIVQNRLKQFQISLIEQCYERKSDADWGRWSRELEQRREEIREELKKGIRTKPAGKDGQNDIDVLIDKSWDELLAVIGGRRETGIDEAKLQSILNKILAPPLGQQAVPAQISVPASPAQTGNAPEEPSPIEELPEVEELSEAEPAEAEAVEEIGEVEAVEELAEAEPVEELAEAEPVEVEPVEELSEVEPVEAEPAEVEAVEELSEAEPAEAEPAEELSEVEPVEADVVEDLSELEPVEAEPAETEAVEELSEAEPTEELAEAEPVEVEPAEELSETEPVEAEVVEDLSELESVEAEPAEAEAVEELSEAEPAEAEPVEELAEAEPAEELSEAELIEELEPAGTTAEKTRPSNVKLVFGDDDIPYIVESSGLELVDEDIDKVMQTMRPESDEPAELEELEELDEAESGIAEEAGEAESGASKQISETDLADLASKIEFSALPETSGEEASMEDDLEVFSPFATMLSDFDGGGIPASQAENEEKDAAETGTEKPIEETIKTGETIEQEETEKVKELPAELDEEDTDADFGDLNSEEEKKKSKIAETENPEKIESTKLEPFNINIGIPVVYKPFQMGNTNLEILEPLPDDGIAIEEIPGEPEVAEYPVIEEREGVHYINKTVLNISAETIKDLNQDFKDLVDSIIE
ncbi:MAG: hypothetical protein LBS48_03460 [Treponema sp.]|nr:hypothetical protein [Treponema sp.]